MTGIELWSTTAASNNSASPNGWPESMPPSGVNDSARQMMAAIRSWYETAEWINLGYTPTYIGATSFSLVGDKTSEFQVGRRIKAYGTTPFTIYGTIATSAYSSVTTVTVTWDSGSLNSTLTTVWIGASSVTNPSIYASAISGLTAAITAASPPAPFVDSTAIVKGSGDATKLLKIEVDGITTGTTRTWTAPDANLTVVGTDTTQTLTNKSLSDSTTTIVDNSDTTKKLAFECSGITTGTTRTVTMPDKSGTMAMTSDINNSIKAWVNFNGTGTVAIRASSNVSSITDNGTGDYTVNFTSALADTNYATFGTCSPNWSSSQVGSVGLHTDASGAIAESAPTTSAARICTMDQSGTKYDAKYVSVQFLNA